MNNTKELCSAMEEAMHPMTLLVHIIYGIDTEIDVELDIELLHSVKMLLSKTYFEALENLERVCMSFGADKNQEGTL